MSFDRTVFNPDLRFVNSDRLRAAYLHYAESQNPDAPTFVTLSEYGFELGIVSTDDPMIARTISSLLTRSLEQARCDKGGHLPVEVVQRVQREIISPVGISTLWGTVGHRFVLSRRHDERTHEIVATILVGRSKDSIFFLTGKYNNLRHSTIAQDIDRDQPDPLDPTHKWFDRFALPDFHQFKPDRYHHIANFVVSPDCRGKGIAEMFLKNITRYYSREVLNSSSAHIVHSQFLLCGKGFWQIGDPPWMARMKKLGFYRRWGAESFFIEHDWAPLPDVVMNGARISNLAYNHMFDVPECYEANQTPHPSNDHLFERVGEVIRLAQHPNAKLQYFQAMFDFATHDGVMP